MNHQEDRHSHPQPNVPFAIGYPVDSVDGYPVTAPPFVMRTIASSTISDNFRPPPAVYRQANPAAAPSTSDNFRPPPAVNRRANPAAPSSSAPVTRPSNSCREELCDCGRKEIRCILLIVLSTILVLGAPIAIGMKLISMRTTEKPDFLLDSIVVSPLNISRFQLTANWTLAIYVKNPNKHYTSIRFENLEVTVLYNKTEFLSNTIIPTFHLRPKNRTTLFATPKAYQQGLSHSVPEKIQEDQRNSSIDFDVELSAQLTFYWPFPYQEALYNANLLCGNVKVGFQEVGHQGTMVADPYQCSYTNFYQVNLSS